jgi:AcrR family transcriptional regulator
MINLKQILSKAEEVFLCYGIKSVTMDDFAGKMSMSKKTLYQLVTDKNDLVKKTMKQHIENEKKAVEEIRKNNENAIDEIFAIGRHVLVHLNKMNPSAMYDLQKYHPEGWKMFVDYKNTFIYSCILQNIEKGIRQGIYRDDFNPDIIAKFYAARTELVVSQDIFPFPKYTVMDVYSEYLRYHIRAIATEKGLKYLEKQKLI